MYNPNTIDPRRVAVDPEHENIAGVATNYGISTA